jgi:hypothetical protein
MQKDPIATLVGVFTKEKQKKKCLLGGGKTDAVNIKEVFCLLLAIMRLWPSCQHLGAIGHALFLCGTGPC